MSLIYAYKQVIADAYRNIGTNIYTYTHTHIYIYTCVCMCTYAHDERKQPTTHNPQPPSCTPLFSDVVLRRQEAEQRDMTEKLKKKTENLGLQ